MRLLDISSLIKTTRADGSLMREIRAVAWDARRATPGCLFVAIPGPGRDTQAAIDAAVDRGAVAVLCEGNEVVSLRATRLQVADMRAALPKVAQLFFGEPDRRMKVIGVVGTYGMSGAALLMKELLDAAGLRCGLIGAAKCEAGDRQLPGARKDWELLDYHDLMAQMARAGCGACVIELAPEAIEQRRLAEIAFDVVVVTTLQVEHLKAMLTFGRMLRLGTKQTTVAINVDEDAGSTLFESGGCGKAVSFGLKPAAEVRASNLELEHGSLSCVVAIGKAEIRCRTQMTGRQNALSLVAACAAGAALQLPLSLMRFALQKAAAPVGSLERVASANGVEIYVDAARAEGELSASLRALREVTRGRILLALGSPCGEAPERRHLLGLTAAAVADHIVLTADNPGREGAGNIASQLAHGIRMNSGAQFHVQLDRAQAIEELIQLALPGDAVLIAGKGHDGYQEFADTIVPFDDREIAKAALEIKPLITVAPLPTHVALPMPIRRPEPVLTAA